MILTKSIRRLSLGKRKLYSQCIILSLLLFTTSLRAEQIAPETVESFIPRLFDNPDELTEEEKAKLAIDVINNAIKSGGGSTVGSKTKEKDEGIASRVPSSKPNPPLVVKTPTDSRPVVIGAQTPADPVRAQQPTINALKEAGLSPTTQAYQRQYQQLQSRWRTEIAGKSMSGSYGLFFQQVDFLNQKTKEGTEIVKGQDNPYDEQVYNNSANGSPEALSSGNLTTKALQALMLEYLIKNPSTSRPLDILIEGIDVASATIGSSPTNEITIDHSRVASIVHTPALDAFNKKEKKIYASILRLEGAGNGQYVVVVIDKERLVCIIDPTIKEKAYKDKLLKAVIQSLNKARTVQEKEYTPLKNDLIPNEQSVINTGIAGQDSDNSKTGIYAFTYWAGLMKKDNLEAYQSINGAAAGINADEVGGMDIDWVNIAAVYSNKLKILTGNENLSSYEGNIREWLRGQLKLDS